VLDISVELFIEYRACCGRLSLVRDDKPGAAIAAMYAEVENNSQLLAGGTVKRINVASVRIIPKMVFYQDLHSYLSLLHNRIIKDETLRRKIKRDAGCQMPGASEEKKAQASTDVRHLTCDIQ
jgi:hypothetical protein